VSVVLSEPGTAEVVFWSDDVGPYATLASDVGTEHQFVVLGLRAGNEYSLKVEATSTLGEEATGAELSFQTGSLPPGIPEFEVEIFDPAAVQPGITVFGPAQVGGPGGPAADTDTPLLIGVDEEGEVVWYYAPQDIVSNHIDRDARPNPDGTLLVPLRNAIRVIRPDGELVLDRSGNDLPGKILHHDGVMLPGGHILALVNELQTHTIDGQATELKGDGLAVWDNDGEVLWEWSAFDHLDVERLPGPLSSEPRPQGGFLDWTHGNGLDFDEENSQILISLRHQSWVIAVNYPAGDIAWTLGEDGDFGLTEGDWFYSQHAPVLLGDSRLLVYDNGNERDITDPDPQSRAVIYSFDGNEAAVDWSWQTDHFTTFLGGATALANGNILVCAGGQRQAGLPAQIVEVTGTDNPAEVWKLSVDDRVIYRSRRLQLYGGPID
jgi:hypothetical protein